MTPRRPQSSAGSPPTTSRLARPPDVADLAIAAGATSATAVKVDAQAAEAWVRSLTDIRLTIAARLGIETDDDLGSEDPAMLDLYDWLGFVQGSLVDCMDR